MERYFVRKYIRFGEWSNWKEVTKEVAERKQKVTVGGWHNPYEVKVVSVG